MELFFYLRDSKEKAMYILRFLAVFFIFLGFAFGQDPYEVRDIGLDVVGSSDRAAKREALRLAETVAFDRLLQRLLLRQDIPAELKEQYRGSSLSLLISDLQISDEKFGSGRYLATATVRFKPYEIRRIFSDYNLPYAETYSAPVLVIALQKEGGRSVLWGESNFLLRALQEQDLPMGLLPYVVPYGDIEDIGLLNLEDVNSFRKFSFADIAERYGVGGVVFMEGTLSGDDLSIRGRLLSVGRSLEFPVRSYDIGSSDISTATVSALRDFQEVWKGENLIAGSFENTLHATLEISDLLGLEDNLRILREVAIIDRAHLLRVSTRQALLAIDYRSSLEQLRSTLFNYGLRLDRRGSTGHWQLRRL